VLIMMMTTRTLLLVIATFLSKYVVFSRK